MFIIIWFKCFCFFFCSSPTQSVRRRHFVVYTWIWVRGATLWFPPPLVHFQTDFGQVPEQFKLLHFGHNFWSNDQFFTCITFINQFLPINITSYGFFYCLLLNHPLTVQSYALLTNWKFTRVIAVLSAFVHPFRFLMGISLYTNASSMFSRVVVTFYLNKV